MEQSPGTTKQDKDISRQLDRIKHKILVLSGKGGVGKSSIAANLAVSLSRARYKVGLMDVDLHGPSIPQMLGVSSKDIKFAGNKIVPARYSFSLSVVSIECLLKDSNSAVIWRGPMKMAAIRQFIADVDWGDLDYLIIDSPPGTGDEPLTVIQTIPDVQGIVVTTPQEVSLRDVRKSINFCHSTKMNILGLIENMSGLDCPKCGEKIDPFKTGGGRALAKEMDIPFLGAIPIIPAMVWAGDSGKAAVTESRVLGRYFDQLVSNLTSRKSQAERELVPDAGAGAGELKIAVPLFEGVLSHNFGSCDIFSLIRTDPKTKSVIQRDDVPAPEHQPGLLPQWFSERGVDVVIAGGVASRIKKLFKDKNIQVVSGAPSQSPENLIEAYYNNSLDQGPDGRVL